MINVSNITNIRLGADKNIKQQADKQSPEPSDRLKSALKELVDVESGKIKLKGYPNMIDLINALNDK